MKDILNVITAQGGRPCNQAGRRKTFDLGPVHFRWKVQGEDSAHTFCPGHWQGCCRPGQLFPRDGEPATSMALPESAVTYAVDDPEHAIRVGASTGIRILSPSETQRALPQYPGFGMPVRLNSLPIANTKEVQLNGNGRGYGAESDSRSGNVTPKKTESLVRPQTKRINSESTGEPNMKTEHDSSGMIGLGHVGMYAKDPASLAEFYRGRYGHASRWRQ